MKIKKKSHPIDTIPVRHIIHFVSTEFQIVSFIYGFIRRTLQTCMTKRRINANKQCILKQDRKNETRFKQINPLIYTFNKFK